MLGADKQCHNTDRSGTSWLSHSRFVLGVFWGRFNDIQEQKFALCCKQTRLLRWEGLVSFFLSFFLSARSFQGISRKNVTIRFRRKTEPLLNEDCRSTQYRSCISGFDSTGMGEVLNLLHAPDATGCFCCVCLTQVKAAQLLSVISVKSFLFS